jgi:hypothetical protein
VSDDHNCDHVPNAQSQRVGLVTTAGMERSNSNYGVRSGSLAATGCSERHYPAAKSSPAEIFHAAVAPTKQSFISGAMSPRKCVDDPQRFASSLAPGYFSQGLKSPRALPLAAAGSQPLPGIYSVLGSLDRSPDIACFLRTKTAGPCAPKVRTKKKIWIERIIQLTRNPCDGSGSPVPIFAMATC